MKVKCTRCNTTWDATIYHNKMMARHYAAGGSDENGQWVCDRPLEIVE